MRDAILKKFPKLSADTAFKITSPHDPNYNCIAWAALNTGAFLWPSLDPKKDGTSWPTDLPHNENLETFILLYERSGYTSCASHEFEDNFQKIAIYTNSISGLVTHAARQTIDGCWSSKLGVNHDIAHGDPFTIEGTTYGVASQFMKRPNSSFKISKIRKPISTAN